MHHLLALLGQNHRNSKGVGSRVCPSVETYGQRVVNSVRFAYQFLVRTWIIFWRICLSSASTSIMS